MKLNNTRFDSTEMDNSFYMKQGYPWIRKQEKHICVCVTGRVGASLQVALTADEF